MIKYLVMRINEGKLQYADVIAKFPHLKEQIDNLLKK